MRAVSRSLFAIAAGLALAARAEGPRLLSTEPAGQVAVESEYRLVLDGIEGEIYLGAGEAGRVRYASMARDGAESPIPVALWLDGLTFRLAPVEGAQPLTRYLQIAVPAGIALVVRGTDTLVRLQGLPSGLEVSGRRMTVTGRGIEGALGIDLVGGVVDLAAIAGPVSVRGTDLDVKISGAGAATFDLTRGTAAIASVTGALAANLDGADFRVDEVQGPAKVRATAGKIALGGLRGESEVRLEGTPLDARDCSGDLDVVTDAAVSFADLNGPLHLDSYGGEVTGKGARSLVEVRSQGGKLQIAGIGGPARIEGTGLELRLQDLGDEVLVYVSSSAVTIENASGPLGVENEFGTISIARASGPVEVSSRKSEVTLAELGGTLQLDADTKEVRAGWATFPKSGESLVKNAGGGAVITLPPRGPGRVEVRTRFGSVESELPEIVPDETGKSAAGDLGKRGAAVIRVVADGDVRLVAVKPPERPEGPRRGRPRLGRPRLPGGS